ncbi:MAG: tRNA (adenosine(37)-N6)-threonylcarbamoyltransferase complex dimerization subunit type 1 TsaB [Flavobacteriales bacterium]
MSDIYLLHLETSTKVCSVVLSKNGNEIAKKESNDDAFAHGEKLTLYIQDVMYTAELQIDQLSGVSVSSGPGSYTGLRIGTSTAKGLCYALNIPLLSISSIESLAYEARKMHPDSTICVMIDARRMEVYCGIYSSDSNVLKPISADILDESTYLNFEPFVLVGDGMPKMKEFWSERNIQFEDEVLCSASGQVEKIYYKYINQEFEDLAYFEPFYLKEFYTVPPKKK